MMSKSNLRDSTITLTQRTNDDVTDYQVKRYSDLQDEMQFNDLPKQNTKITGVWQTPENNLGDEELSIPLQQSYEPN
jgi:hypothetical protein